MKKSIGIIFTALLSYFLLACAGNDTARQPNGTPNDNNEASSASGGNGYYYELTTNTHSARFSASVVFKMFFSQDGNVRTEMTTTGLPGKKERSTMVLIGNASNTAQSTSIDDSAKTYTINHIDMDDIKADKQITSNAVKVGEEKIGSYNCVHARIFATRHMGILGNMVDTIDTWKSNDVAMPAQFKKWMDNFETKTGGSMYSLETVKQLEDMGCTGFPVKLQMNTKSSSMLMQLTKAERRDFPHGLFEIPAGYTENKNGF